MAHKQNYLRIPALHCKVLVYLVVLVCLVEMTVTGCFEKKMKIFVLRFYVEYLKKKYLGQGVKIG